MRNYDESQGHGWVLIVPAMGLFLGALAPFLVTGYDRHLIHMLNGSYELLIISLMALVMSLFTHIGEKNPALGHWACHTLTGCTLTMFAYGLLVSGVPLGFVLLPLPAPVLFIFAVATLVATGCLVLSTTEK